MAADRLTPPGAPPVARKRRAARSRGARRLAEVPLWPLAAEAMLRGLPPRLREVADLLVHSGLSYKEIAGAMGIGEGTVRVHVQQLYRRLGVGSRPRLVELLQGWGEEESK